MYIITDEIATHGIGETVHPLPWTDRKIGTLNDWKIYDVRFLSDLGEENPDAIYALTINDIHQDICDYNDGQKVVICCGAGQSRSCAIAVGVLMQMNGMNYYDAVELVKLRVPICHMDPSHLAALRRLFHVGPP